MGLWSWVQLVAAALSTGALVLSIAADGIAASIKTLDRSSEAWAQLYRSRLALLVSLLLALLALAAAYHL
jgi:hypothetical protein